MSLTPAVAVENPAAQYALKPRRARWIGWALFGGLSIVLFLMMRTVPAEQVDLSEFYAQIRNGNVAAVTITGDSLLGQFRRPVTLSGQRDARHPIQSFQTHLPIGMANSWPFTQWLLENSHGAAVRVDNNQDLLVNILVPLIPWLLVFGFIWFFVFRQLRAQTKKAGEPLPVVIVNPPAKE